MELGQDNILKLKETDNNFSEIPFVEPSSANVAQDEQDARFGQVLNEIKENVWGCDLILCFFFAALNSYRSDKCLRPFPPDFIGEQEKDFNRLRQVCDSIPPLSTILANPKDCNQQVKRLLIWLFLDKRYPCVKKINFNRANFPGRIREVYEPHFLFEVSYADKIENVWKARKGERDIILAYHGSLIDNFYSIFNAGLLQHFSSERDVLFGTGIYLSDEISVSAHYAPFGQTWINSILGSKHSVIAVCEIINDVNKVRCKDSKNRRRSYNTNSVGEIPENYFVVTDSDMVRVKYLMVYRQKKSFSVWSYLSQHLFVTTIILCFVTIVAIGLFSNTQYIRSFKRFVKSFSQFQ